MSRLAPFTAIAVTMVQLPWFPSHFHWSRQPIAIGFLSYDPKGPQGAGFDLAVRIRTYGERASLPGRWFTMNVPPGLWVGWDLRADIGSLVARSTNRSLESLCRPPRVAGLISLKNAAGLGHDLVMASADAGIRCDMRDVPEKFDDYYTSSHERMAAGIILDTVATFRLTLIDVLGELRGGAPLLREIEMQMAEALDVMVRQAVSDIPGLSRQVEGSAVGLMPSPRPVDV